jgi:RNA recognition motif-containing protein
MFCCCCDAGCAHLQDFVIFVGDLPKEAADADLRTAFESCGPILRASVIRKLGASQGAIVL